MKVIVQLEEDGYKYELALKDLLKYLDVPREKVEIAIKRMIREL